MDSKGEELYQAALAADIAWSRELRQKYGSEATAARYDLRANSSDELRDLNAKRNAAYEAWYAHLSATTPVLTRVEELRQAA